ncbi:single-stranded DNA-binding protein 2 [Spirochaetia bacterium]|nr:single-stranded DNA-binding protein 2 [Spirochaetia bacterium]
MNNLNSIIIEGNLVRDPLFRFTPKGTPVCTFSIASNRFYKQDTGVAEEVSYFDVTTWTKLAESCSTLGHKGRGVKVVGRLKQDRWQDPEGKSHSKVMVVAEHVEFRPEFKRDASAQETATVSETMAAEAAEGEAAAASCEDLAPVTF